MRYPARACDEEPLALFEVAVWSLAQRTVVNQHLHGNCPLAERPQKKVTPNAPSNIPPMGAKKRLLRARPPSRHRVGSCAANGAG